MSDQQNFKLIKIKEGRDAHHLFFLTDNCLYKKNGSKNNVQYYICTGIDELNSEKCKVTGKLVEGNFSITKSVEKHNHDDHGITAEAQQIYASLKEQITESSDTIENLYSKIIEK